MTPIVVDTNVPVVANGRDHPPGCVQACVERLVGIRDRGTLVLDAGWEIIREYRSHLRSEGQPGVGDAFLKWVLTNWANPARCAMVNLRPHAHRCYEEFPGDPRLAAFDRADRKFVAVARAHQDKPPILQALDSEWWGYRQALLDNGVTVEFLCPTEIRALHAKKHGTP